MEDESTIDTLSNKEKWTFELLCEVIERAIARDQITHIEPVLDRMRTQIEASLNHPDTDKLKAQFDRLTLSAVKLVEDHGNHAMIDWLREIMRSNASLVALECLAHLESLVLPSLVPPSASMPPPAVATDPMPPLSEPPLRWSTPPS